MAWKKRVNGDSTDPNSHTHSNKAMLDKFGEVSGKPTFNGVEISGGSSSEPIATDSSGLFYDYQNLWVSGVSNQDFIEVEPEATYISNCLKTIPCYDENKQLISSVTPVINNDSNYFAPRPFITPTGTKYVKPNMPGIFNTSWNQRIILIKGNVESLPVHFQYIGNDPTPLKFIPNTDEIFFFFKNNDYAKSLRAQTSPLYGKKINFLGDSITYGHWTNDDGNEVITYHDLLSKKFNIKANNYGYAGSGFVNLWNHADSAGYFQRALTMSTDVDLNIVWGGFNDRQQTLGTFGDVWNSSSPTIYGGLDQLIKNLDFRFPNTPTIFLIHFANDEFTTPINNAVKKMCNLHRIPYIELSNTMLKDNYDRTILEQFFRASDWNTTGIQGIHPNSDGYKVIARYLSVELERTLDYL